MHEKFLSRKCAQKKNSPDAITTLLTVSGKSIDLAINTEVEFNFAASGATTEIDIDTAIVHKPEEMTLEMHTSPQQNQSFESPDFTHDVQHSPEALNMHQSVTEQLPPLAAMQENDPQNMPKESEQPLSEAIGHQQHTQEHTQSK